MRSLGHLPVLALALAGAAGVVVLAGVLPLPDPYPAARDAVDELGAWTYLLVGAVVLLETSVGLGMLSPGEAVIAVAGAAAAAGVLDPVVLVAVAWCCGVAGDTLSWALGRRYGQAALPRIGRRIGLTPARVDRVAARVARGGGWVLIAGRFVGPVRVLAPFLCGASGMRYRKFLPFDVVGIALWAGTYLAIGWAFSDALESATGRAGQIGIAVLLAGGIVVLALRRISPAPGPSPTPDPARPA